MSVNLSTKEFQRPELADEIAEVLQRTGLMLRALQLEITETVIMEQDEFAPSAHSRSSKP
jgi:EAL domain-containing protein (putative c-di-GMP-specific phosphodiesterase class I)